MKNVCKYLIMPLIVAAMCFSAEAQNRVTVTQNKFALKGDSVYIDLQIELNNADIPKNSFVLLTPAIQADSTSMELPVVMINGKKREKAYHRLVALRGKPDGLGLVINPGDNNAQRSYYYSAAVPFETWMEDAEFALSEEQCECNGPLVKMSFNLIAGRMYDMNTQLNFTASFREPAPEPVKTRSETGTAYFEFAIGRSFLDPAFNNNTAELVKIGEMIKKVQNDPANTITRIIINGKSSPDGAYAINMMLSDKRASTLKDYIRTVYVIDNDIFCVTGNGEDWNSFEKIVESLDVAWKDEVLKIIRSEDDYDTRENKLKALQGGAPYRDMYVNIFPKLRRTDYELQYTVIPFTVEEGKKILETQPSQLSLNEMFLIAETYPVGSAEFQQVFDIAVKAYPESEIANFNAAANALSSQDINVAQKFLENVKIHDYAYWNNIGMLTAMQGNYDEAAEYFRKAVEGGNEEAVKNLAEIGKLKKTFYSVIK